jgi:glycosyltransferase involved in cell wall biosynthesis
MTAAPLLTVLIPAYNESAGLARCVSAVEAELGRLGGETEILVVNDGSRDRTGPIADGLVSEFPRLRVLHHAANLGIGAAFKTGLENARGEFVILIPADLAMDLADLGKYLVAAQAADIVVGLRPTVSDYSAFRRLVHYGNIGLLRLLFGAPARQYQYISLYRRATVRQFKLEFTGGAFFLAELIIKAWALGARLAEVEVRFVPRATGRATGANRTQIWLTVRDILRFYWRWLRLGKDRAARWGTEGLS